MQHSTIILNHALPPDDNQASSHGHKLNTGLQRARVTNPSTGNFNALQMPNLKRLLYSSHIRYSPHRAPNALNTGLECAVADALGCPDIEEPLPFAALKALELGPNLTKSSPDAQECWAFINLCGWSVQHGQVTCTGDAKALGLTAHESMQLLEDLTPYFLEDAIELFSHPILPPGQWLARSTHFYGLKSPSIQRISQRVIDDFLIGAADTVQPPSASTLRRLQNEMQMLLHQHPINDHRSIAINSFWISGCADLRKFKKTVPEIKSQLDQILLVDVLQMSEINLADSSLEEYQRVWSTQMQLIDELYLSNHGPSDKSLQPSVCQASKLQSPKLLYLCSDLDFTLLRQTEAGWMTAIKNLLTPKKLSDLLRPYS
jgi:hypothetical protein